MSINKKIICLANSRKLSGRCIAGKELNNNIIGKWVRPISERQNHEISEEDRRYQDGTMAKNFDIINIPCKSKTTHPAQIENYIIDNKYYWVKQGFFNDDVNKLVDCPNSLWKNGFSSYNGLNDRVPINKIKNPQQSLYFLALSNIEIIVRIEGAEFNNAKRKVRASFIYNNTKHLLSVTDPVVESNYLAQGDGTYTIEGLSYMTVSLGEPWNGYYYKLSAAIFK